MFRSLFSLVLIFAFNANASTIDQLTQQAKQLKLSQNPQWLALGHYTDFKPKTGVADSYVDDPVFFLSEKGQNYPELELLSTLEAAATAVPEAAEQRNQHPRCRFIARYQWLSEQLNIDFDDRFGSIDCSDYKKWRTMVNAHSVSLAYPAAHLNSPSSMYGHTLLRLDPKEKNSDWLSWAVNFGANIPEGDNSIVFAYKGIAGGYPGLFNVLPYYEKLQEYGRMEDRDLWEYQLNLTPEETNRLVEHLWELKNINFAYFFFDENCSYRLLELLEIARPSVELTDDFPLFAIPIDTVRSVYKAGLIESNHYRPSVNSQLHAQAALLTDAEGTMALNLINSTAPLDDVNFKQLDSDRKALVIQTAYRMFRQEHKKSPQNADLRKHNFALLQAMKAFPVAQDIVIQKPVPPEHAHDSSMWGLSWGVQNNVQHIDAELRLSFHNLSDRHQGFLPGAAIDMGKLVLRQYDGDDLQVQEANFIDIHSSTPRNRFFKPLSWKVKFGAERKLMASKDVLATHVTGGAGVSYEWGTLLGYGLVLGRLEANTQFKHDYGAAGIINLGAVHYADFGNTHIDYAYSDFSSNYYRSEISLKQSIALSKNKALRFDFSYNDNTDLRYKQYSLHYRQHF